MSKLSKFIICCISIIISICSFVVPTYCLDSPPDSTYSIELTSDFNSFPNFYNENNLQYVFIENFSINRRNDLVLYCTTSNSVSDLANLNGTRVNETQDIFLALYGQKYKIAELYTSYSVSYSGTTLTISMRDYSFNLLENVKIPLGYSYEDWTSINIKIPHAPLSVLQLLPSSVNGLHLYNYWSCSFDINYNNQYFYNDYFGMNFYCHWPLFTKQYSSIDTNSTFTLSLVDNNNVLFSRVFDYTNFYKQGFLFSNNYNSSFSYINNVSLNYGLRNMFFGTTSKDWLVDDFYMSSIFYFSSSTGLDNNSYTLYSSNSYGNESLNGSLIPNGSNNFYKSGEWWDIPTHLYNFFIYLIFDAPIISNFTELVLILINFIVEVFEFIIGLFTGINNIFFISIFVGIIVLIFLLKIIFKG